jgi:hypothetical protein
MNNELLDQLALRTGGSHFPAVFHHYQKDYVMQVLSEIYDVFQKQQFDGYAIDFWDDIVKHFQLDNYEIEKLHKNNKETA